MKKLLQIIRDWPWEYGTCTTDGYGPQRARRHRLNGEVQFVAWKAGEQGHAQDYWCAYHAYWWPNFKKGNHS